MFRLWMPQRWLGEDNQSIMRDVQTCVSFVMRDAGVRREALQDLVWPPAIADNERVKGGMQQWGVYGVMLGEAMAQMRVTFTGKLRPSCSRPLTRGSNRL